MKNIDVNNPNDRLEVYKAMLKELETYMGINHKVKYGLCALLDIIFNKVFNSKTKLSIKDFPELYKFKDEEAGDSSYWYEMNYFSEKEHNEARLQWLNEAIEELSTPQLREIKVYVKDKIEVLQEALFRLDKDIKWIGSGKRIVKSIMPFIFIDNNGTISMDNSTSFFYNSPYKEYQVEDILDMIPKINYSILNNKDIFYVLLEPTKGEYAEHTFIYADRDDESLYYERSFGGFVNTKYHAYQEDSFDRVIIRELRLANEEEIESFFKVYPDIAPPRIGDIGMFYDCPKARLEFFEKYYHFQVSKLSKISSNGSFFTGTGTSWEHFYRIDPTMPFSEIIDNFKNHLKEEIEKGE